MEEGREDLCEREGSELGRAAKRGEGRRRPGREGEGEAWAEHKREGRGF